MRHLYLLSLFLLLNASLSHAKHIIGGVLTYECLGGGNYRFTMKMYRDCTDPTGANFDFNAPFSIYKGGSQSPLTTLYVGPQSITPIMPDDSNPCLEIPPNVCVQEGIYVFDYKFAEWPSTQSYHISYQRCCRNATVANIKTPGNVGATFTVELTAASQAVCNNSPVYNTFPPIVICANEALKYNHSAFDEEGDQLIYELCSPLIGGGQGGLGGGSPTGCNGITPNPACPPPYLPVSFVNPPYSPLNPMGGSPPMTIDAITGMLTGTPQVQGQFSVGVCVSEYRNGKLLSVIRRDFQFNVGNCEPLVKADIDAAGVVQQNKDYFIETCNGLNISIQNHSTEFVNISDWRWEFYVGDSIYQFDSWDANVTFPATGIYEGKLLLNPGLGICADTAIIHIEIFPEIRAAFDYSYDTCRAGPVNFFNQSQILGPGSIAGFKWNMGDGFSDTVLNNPAHVFKEPGIIPVRLEVRDQNGCKDDTIRSVIYTPVPALILVRPDDTLSCPPATVTFNNLSTPIDETYDIRWDFGDGQTGDDISPAHVYEETGVFDVRLEITSPIGCYADTVFKNLVTIVPRPVAGFYYDPTDPSNLAPAVNFFDQSIDAVHWDWYIDGKLVNQQTEFSYAFPDTGIHEVTLIITHPEKCQDTLTQLIDVVPKVTFFLPNAFSPNEDSVNDFFMGTGITRGVRNFKLEIWNRWGQKVFETTDPETPWNGRVNNTGSVAQVGVYVCLVSFTGPRGEPFEYQGYATLIR
jgi:gliding motility-associated-like protein